VRIVIAEDLFLLREGLASLLKEHGFDVAEAVADGPSLLRALIDHRPDVAIVDVRLPPTHTDEGLRAALQARQQVPGLPILVLSAHVEQLYARELLADLAGGVGYLLKDRVFTDEQFTDALRTVARGGTVMDPEVVAKLLARRSRQMPITRLSTREHEVLALMAEGRSNSAIAQYLFISEKAVSKHSTSIFAKLDLPPSEDHNRRVLAVLAYLNALPRCRSRARTEQWAARRWNLRAGPLRSAFRLRTGRHRRAGCPDQAAIALRHGGGGRQLADLAQVTIHDSLQTGAERAHVADQPRYRGLHRLVRRLSFRGGHLPLQRLQVGHEMLQVGLLRRGVVLVPGYRRLVGVERVRHLPADAPGGDAPGIHGG
jgi:DNA-binding NarL/FixJ family response regulator